MAQNPPTFGLPERSNAEVLIDLALSEDFGTAGDITANATIPADAMGKARFVARTAGTVAGLPVVGMIAEKAGLASGWMPLLGDGSKVEPGAVLATIEGSMRAILGVERTALNFLQRLSGVSSLTARFVAAVVGTRAVVLDTRKTTPGWRVLEKYAVRCGGGQNHRMALHDAFLIKDNHLAWLAQHDDPIGAAIGAARSSRVASAFVEVEVDSLTQLDRALECKPDIILVDNLGATDLAEAVRRRDASDPKIQLEASGRVSLETIRGLAESGVDRISVGAITHSAPALDIGLDYEA